jgi:hypothetical protein
MQKLPDCDPPAWIADSLSLSDTEEASMRQKVASYGRKHELPDAPPALDVDYSSAVKSSSLPDVVRYYARGLKCPVAAYYRGGEIFTMGGGLLFFEVQDENPQPDLDLLLGFPAENGDFIVTRRGTTRIRSDIIAN